MPVYPREIEIPYEEEVVDPTPAEPEPVPELPVEYPVEIDLPEIPEVSPPEEVIEYPLPEVLEPESPPEEDSVPEY